MATSFFSDLLNDVNRKVFGFEGRQSNVLHKYATYNYIWTLSIISKDMVNFPSQSYKKGNIGRIILKSGSGDPGNRVSLGDFGMYDYMIDDVKISSIVGFNPASGNAHATSFSFKIYEPYSIGLFFESLQIAALDEGYDNYLSAPFLLTLEFVGNLSPNDIGINGDALHPIEKTTRHLPMKFSSMEMEVNEAGSTYSVEAIPWNETAATTTYAEIKDDITISGSSVVELLQNGPKSLEAVINKKWIKDAEEFNKDPDELIIIFPKDMMTDTAQDKTPQVDATKSSSNSATVNPKPLPNDKPKYQTLLDVLQVTTKVIDDLNLAILVQQDKDVNGFGTAKMNFNAYSGKSTPFADDNFVYDEQNHVYNRGGMSLKVNNGVGDMKFQSGTSIMHIINEVILMSEYGQKALQQAEVDKYKGNILWWRIDFQSYVSPSAKNTFTSGEPSLVQVYRVVPYKISAARFLPPRKSMPPEYIEEAKKQVIKEFNYIYTGKNIDVISFEMNFAMASYQATFNVNNTGDQKTKANQASLSEPPGPNSEQPFNILDNVLFDPNKLSRDLNNMVRRVRVDAIRSLTNSKGGSLSDTSTTRLVKQAHDIIINGVDMINPKLKILGDPFFVGDSGWGNYTAQETSRDHINADHSMNYQNGEVYVIVNFRTPLDIDMATGIYDFGDTKVVSQFSGLYNVSSVESSFSKGKFTQELDLLRQTGQDPETGQLMGKNSSTVSNKTG